MDFIAFRELFARLGSEEYLFYWMRPYTICLSVEY